MMRVDGRHPWTDSEVEIATRLYRRHAHAGKALAIAIIAQKLGRRESDVRNRWHNHGGSFARARAAKLERPTCRAPDDVLRERDLRKVASDRRDLTAAFCGDPAPGYSALDRKRAEQVTTSPTVARYRERQSAVTATQPVNPRFARYPQART